MSELLRRHLALALCVLSLACSAPPSPSPADGGVPADVVEGDVASADGAVSADSADSVTPDVRGVGDSEFPGDVRETEGHLQVVAPVLVRPETPFPLVVRVEQDGEPAWSVYGQYELAGTALPAVQKVRITRGAGSISTTVPETGVAELFVSGGGLTGSRTVTVESLVEPRELTGALVGADLVWGPEEVILLTGSPEVPAGSLLTVHGGTTVLLQSKVNLTVKGEVLCEGTADSPVLFAPADPNKAWGGIVHQGGAGEYRYTFFTGGGGDGSKVFGHSGSQAVLFADGGTLTLINSFVLDNKGKGLGSQAAQVDLYDSLISRCDTGGELKKSQVTFYRTYFLEMPSADGVPVDDDNDCIYLHNPPDSFAADEPSAVINECVFAMGKDDGIDHNGSRIRITNSFVEDFHHEGVACSKNNWVEVYNTLVMRCGQGIESGYGSPHVTVDHCALVDNEVGIRLGDSYEDPIKGSLEVTNSISVDSAEHNVWNYSRADQGPLPGQLSVSHSIVDDPEWDTMGGNVPGKPIFDGNFRLLDGSPGKGAASDGLDIGLL